jgi:hypothetical protein
MDRQQKPSTLREINAGRLQALRALEFYKFLSEAFEHRMDSRRKQSVIACFKLRDFSPQPIDANFAVRRSFHSRFVRAENCAPAITSAETHDVFATIMPIW